MTPAGTFTDPDDFGCQKIILTQPERDVEHDSGNADRDGNGQRDSGDDEPADGGSVGEEVHDGHDDTEQHRVGDIEKNAPHEGRRPGDDRRQYIAKQIVAQLGHRQRLS